LTILPKTSKKGLGLMMCFVVLSSLTFFMTTSTISNEDSCFWLQESTISTAYTIQEVKGAETISCYSEQAFSDSRYGSSVLGVHCGLQHDSLDSRDLSDHVGGVFVWREYMENRPIRMFTTLEGYYKQVENNVVLGPEYLRELEKMQKIYENDDVSGYYID